MRNIKIMGMVLSLFFVLGFTKAGFSQDFPKNNIRLIVPAPAGGGSDLMGRGIAAPLEKILGTRVLVEDIPGGSGKIGAMAAKNAKPDGYSLILAGPAWVGFYYQKVYNTKLWLEMTPIGNISTEAYTIIEVRADSPYKTWADFAKAAKENPGKLTCAVMGVGGARLISMKEIRKRAGIEWQDVYFTGAAPGTTALLGGHIDFKISTPAEAIAMIRAGKTRGLALSSERRIKALPDVPTFKELGIAESMGLTRNIWGPPNIPPNIVDVLTKALEKATKDPTFVKLAEDQFICEVEYMPPDRLREELKDFDKKYGQELAEMFK